MSRRTHPADQVVVFFETAPLEQCQMILVIARGILARRTPKAKRTSGSATSTETAKQEARPARKGAPLLDGAETAQKSMSSVTATES
jgi:hypothetical protein